MLAGAGALFLAGGFSSCSKDDKNFEAEILNVQLKEPVQLGNISVEGTNITIFVKADADVTKLTPILTISRGAVSLPASEQVKDFTNPVEYVITSEDGKASRKYLVKVVKEVALNFGFENWVAAKGEEDTDLGFEQPAEGIWSSGNLGLYLSKMIYQKPDLFPTGKTDADKQSGKYAAELVTREMGIEAFGVGQISIAAGSLFLGKFDTQYVMSDPLKCPSFGVPFTGRKPVSFTGYYKYAPGAKFVNKESAAVAGKTDECAIYAVLFTGKDPLHPDDVLTSNRIVALAKLKDGSAKDKMTKFDIPFEYKLAGEALTKALSGDLMVAIVFSSSARGDYYEGAVGSRLVVDDVKVVREFDK